MYKDITVFKKDYHPTTNMVKDERGFILVRPHKIVNRWKNYLSVIECDVRETEIHTAEPSVPDDTA
jgi:hypothetical protein